MEENEDADEIQENGGRKLSMKFSGIDQTTSSSHHVTTTKSRTKSIDRTTLPKSVVTLDDEQEILTEGQCKLNHILVLHHEALCSQASHDGRLVAIGLLSGTIRVYDPPIVNCLFVLASRDVIKTATSVTSIKFQPSLRIGALKTHIMASSYANGLVKLWNVENKTCLHTLEEDRQTLTTAFSRDGRYLATSGSDGKIFIYDVETKEMIIILEAGQSSVVATGHKSRVFSLVYHPLDFHSLISGGWDSIVHIWDDRQKHSIRTIFGPHICGDGIDLIAEENLVMTASWHKKHPLQLWHFETCDLIKNVVPDTSPCLNYCGQFMKKNYMITGGSNINMVRIIDRLSYSTIAAVTNLPNSVISITHNPYFVHPKVVCVSGDKIFVVDVKLRPVKTEEETI